MFEVVDEGGGGGGYVRGGVLGCAGETEKIVVG